MPYAERSPHRHDDTLQKLADALGISSEAFLGDLPEGEVGELLTLMRHWYAIGDGQGRRRILSVARQEAERFNNKPS